MPTVIEELPVLHETSVITVPSEIFKDVSTAVIPPVVPLWNWWRDCPVPPVPTFTVIVVAVTDWILIVLSYAGSLNLGYVWSVPKLSCWHLNVKEFNAIRILLSVVNEWDPMSRTNSPVAGS